MRLRLLAVNRLDRGVIRVAVTQAELARRLKAARINSNLTQQQVADVIGIPRTAVAQIEAGNRAVNSLELDKMARLYGRSVAEFLSDDAFEDDPIIALFRADPGMVEDGTLANELRRCAHLSREATRLERLLDLPASRAVPVTYSLETPASRWDAISQGRYLAEQERSRLGLGASPIWEIAEIIRRQGVRVTEYDMPEDVSGLFFHSRDVGLVIVVNRRHHRNRRLFSYAHEYCHLLVDRNRPGTVSRMENRNELAEVRANAFAAHFLLPETGVRAFLQSLGKGVDVRPDLQIHDIVALAHHFGVSYEAALYHLLNLKLISKGGFEVLKDQQDVANRLARVFRLAGWDENAHWNLAEQILTLGFEAYRRGEISRNKLLELAADAGVEREEVEEALVEIDEDFDPVDPVLPE